MEIKKILASAGYKDARNKIDEWMKRLKTAKADEALRISDEKATFFNKMKDSAPELYSVLAIDEKTLSGIIFKKLTGMDVIID
jgi:hypothetical protein